MLLNLAILIVVIAIMNGNNFDCRKWNEGYIVLLVQS